MKYELKMSQAVLDNNNVFCIKFKTWKEQNGLRFFPKQKKSIWKSKKSGIGLKMWSLSFNAHMEHMKCLRWILLLPDHRDFKN